jgi:hypothetical protein
MKRANSLPEIIVVESHNSLENFINRAKGSPCSPKLASHYLRRLVAVWGRPGFRSNWITISETTLTPYSHSNKPGAIYLRYAAGNGKGEKRQT